jgi:transketolase
MPPRKKGIDYRFLEGIAKGIRKDILTTIYQAGSGHPGGSLSCVEILIALYFYKMKVDPKRPDWQDRDLFVLSKGHSCPALYTILAYKGFFPKEELSTFRKLNSRLQGHAYKGVPGVEASTGSLGQGLSITNGMAIAAKYDKRDTRIYCLLGDGEIEEGQVWEAIMSASFRRLDNLCAILDRNKIQQDDRTDVIKDLEPIRDKWEASGWRVIEVDGHNLKALIGALDKADKTKKPTLIMAHTIKGKGVSFMENSPKWHGKAPNKDELEKALADIDKDR